MEFKIVFSDFCFSLDLWDYWHNFLSILKVLATSSSNLLPQIHLFPQETYNCSTETLKGGNIISVSKFLKLNHCIRRDRLVKTNMVITGANKIWIQFCFPVNTLDHLDIHKYFLFLSNMNFSGIRQSLCFNIIKE